MQLGSDPRNTGKSAESKGGQSMVERELLKQKPKGQLDDLDLADEEKYLLARELDELACILIDACQARDAGAKS